MCAFISDLRLPGIGISGCCCVHASAPEPSESISLKFLQLPFSACPGKVFRRGLWGLSLRFQVEGSKLWVFEPIEFGIRSSSFKSPQSLGFELICGTQDWSVGPPVTRGRGTESGFRILETFRGRGSWNTDDGTRNTSSSPRIQAPCSSKCKCLIIRIGVLGPKLCR